MTYTIRLQEKVSLSDELFDGIKGVAHVEQDRKRQTLMLTLSEKSIDDAAEILQEAVARIREEGGAVHAEKVSLPVLKMSCAACASASQTILPKIGRASCRERV